MSRNLQLGLMLAFIVFCAYLIYPTIQWYFLMDSQTQALVSLSNEKLYAEVQEKIATSLSEIRDMSLEAPLARENTWLIPYATRALKTKGMGAPATWKKADFQQTFSTDADLENLTYDVYQFYLAKKQAKNHILNLGLDLAGGLGATLSLNFDQLEADRGEALSREEKDEAVRQTIEGLRERIDQFGLTDPQITRESSSHRIFVDIPGDPDLGRIESFLKGSNSLSFHIVLEEATARAQEYFRENPLSSTLPAGFLREDEALYAQYQKDRYGFDDKTTAQWFVLSTREEDSFNGSYVSDATVGQDGITYRPTVNFFLKPEGAEAFFQLTNRNKGKAMAVVFEGSIRSIAGIATGIAGGRVSISGDRLTLSDVNDLTYVLRSVAFPVEIFIDNWRVVGPTLGTGNITAGVKALLLGLGGVMIFMLGYYRMAGLAAVKALFVNFFVLIAILSTFGLTLTLTSLAGLVLTIGMAVDTNVIIFERIKEEFRDTGDWRQSVRVGFDKAIWTVLDANITTFIAAFFLSILGTGPVQGFAWTLAWGILTSLFAAIFVTRLLLSLWLDMTKGKLSIGWGVRYVNH